MRRTTWWALLACGALIGCGEPAKEGLDVSKAPANSEAKPGGPEKVPAAVEAKASVLTPEEVANIKKLPEADAKLALEQQVCPVSGDHLGAEGMGEPIKVTAEGKTVMLCCEGCKEPFEKEPAKYMAKLAAPK